MKYNKIAYICVAAAFGLSVGPQVLTYADCDGKDAHCCKKSKCECKGPKHKWGKNFHKRSFRAVVKGGNCAVYALEALKFKPYDELSLWDKDYLNKNSKVADLLRKFIDGQHANSVKQLFLETNKKDEVIKVLEKAGFKSVECGKDDRHHHKNRHHECCRQCYIHDDGGAVKIITFKHDKGSKIIMKKLVLFSSDNVSWDNVAFILSDGGAPMPKSFNDGMRDLGDDDEDSNFGWREMIFQESVTKLED
ncbi:MAG: hypothetical protein LBL30_02630 [Holosporales bacterium]|nr:hypothetical protein [Holosporales bacterium]